MKQFVLCHTHKWGSDNFYFKSEYDWLSLTDPTNLLAEKLCINFEPDLGEELELEEIQGRDNPIISGP